MVGAEDVDVEDVGGVVMASEDAAGLEELLHAVAARITAAAITRCRFFMHRACLTGQQRHGRFPQPISRSHDYRRTRCSPAGTVGTRCRKRLAGAVAPVLIGLDTRLDATGLGVRGRGGYLMDLVDNTTVRGAVAEFAAQPDLRRALDVLRSCMYGELLFDITGSDEPEDGSFRRGSLIQFRGGTGPGGGGALFSFTCQEEIARLYPPRTRIQSFVTPAIGALEFARQQGNAWLYIDPAGPTCALAAEHIDFALRYPNNAPLKAALATLHAAHTDRRDVLQVLRTEGPILLAADETTVPGKAMVRSTPMPDGSPALAAFTSAPEVIAFNVSDAFFSITTLEALQKVRADGYSGIVINPAGPSVAFSKAEIEIGL